MKVLHILNSNKFSGAENVVITIIKNMPKHYECCYMSCNGPIEQNLKKNNIQYMLVDKLSVKSIKSAVKKYSPDIIHAHDFKASVLASQIGFSGILISHIHNNNPFMRSWNLKSLLYLMCIKKFKNILGVSKSILTECVYSKRLKPKFIEIGNPIDINTLSSHYVKKVKKYDLIYLGRLTEAKDPFRFVRIVKEIYEQDKSIKAIMIGDGELMADVLSKIEESDLKHVIDVKGFQENPFEFLLESKMMFMTSKWEGFGLVVVEAMSMGVPVACTRVGGMPQLISDNCGALCDNDSDFMEFYKKLKDYSIYDSFCKNAFARAEELGNIESYIRYLTDKVYVFNSNEK